MYEGPLDLLLDLIKQQKMNIHDIRISEITAQYLDYLHKLEELDVDVSAEFIYMAATLIYIKSKMLLPPDPLSSEEEQAADPRVELVQRLVEHEKFKNAAQLLYQRQQIEENVWSKPDKSLYNDEGTEGELVVSLVDLVKVFQQVLERRKEVARIELQHELFTVAQMIAQLRSQILASEDSSVNLIQFFEACPSRRAMISSRATPRKNAASKFAPSPAATKCTRSRSITMWCGGSSRVYGRRCGSRCRRSKRWR